MDNTDQRDSTRGNIENFPISAGNLNRYTNFLSKEENSHFKKFFLGSIEKVRNRVKENKGKSIEDMKMILIEELDEETQAFIKLISELRALPGSDLGYYEDLSETINTWFTFLINEFVDQVKGLVTLGETEITTKKNLSITAISRELHKKTSIN